MKISDKNQKGIAILEVILAIGVASLVIVSVGQSLSSMHKLTGKSETNEKALAYAKEYLEIINDTKNIEFKCVCSGTPPVCLTSQGNSCTCNLLPGYTSCWTQYPNTNSLTSNSELHLDSNRRLQARTNAAQPEPIPGDQTFTREINITHLDTDGRFNQKKIDVLVTWKENNQDKNLNLSTILTAWQN